LVLELIFIFMISIQEKNKLIKLIILK